MCVPVGALQRLQDRLCSISNTGDGEITRSAAVIDSLADGFAEPAIRRFRGLVVTTTNDRVLKLRDVPHNSQAR
jgi:hypothetical protein